MDSNLKTLVEILKNATGPVIIRCNDIDALQRDCFSGGVLLAAKKVPYTYVTRAGYTWQHNNSREYQINLRDE